MIANLFEEYKFFNRYPDRQLKLAAIFVGNASYIYSKLYSFFQIRKYGFYKFENDRIAY